VFIKQRSSKKNTTSRDSTLEVGKQHVMVDEESSSERAWTPQPSNNTVP